MNTIYLATMILNMNVCDKLDRFTTKEKERREDVSWQHNEMERVLMWQPSAFSDKDPEAQIPVRSCCDLPGENEFVQLLSV